MLPEPEVLKSAGTAILLLAAVICTMRGAFVLLFRVPAKGSLTYDGYRRMCEARDSAVLLAERPPMPYTVDDAIAFSTAQGRKVHVTVRSYAKPRDRTLLVWYSPHRPESVSTAGPFSWFARALACLGTIILLFRT